jgi:FkbM family methyltransferase
MLTEMKRALHKAYGGTQIVRVCRDWHSWFYEYLAGSNDGAPARYRMRNGAVFNTRRNRMDIRIIDEIWAFRKYDYFGYKVTEGSVVVDVGANIGVFAIYAVMECRADRVIAFEPHPDNYALLERNVHDNGLTNVTCVNAAVSAFTGTATLHVTPANSGGHSLTAPPTAESLEVPTLTLDRAAEIYHFGAIDYLKLDCEGAEYAILDSVSPELLAQVDRISMEYHDVAGRSVTAIAGRLSDHGFSVRLAERDRLYATR